MVLLLGSPLKENSNGCYVLCPNLACHDPVGGHLPQPREALKLTCLHCKQTFTFEEGDVRRGIVSYDGRADRWKVERFKS
jgi:hypothetical protein